MALASGGAGCLPDAYGGARLLYVAQVSLYLCPAHTAPGELRLRVSLGKRPVCLGERDSCTANLNLNNLSNTSGLVACFLGSLATARPELFSNLFGPGLKGQKFSKIAIVFVELWTTIPSFCNDEVLS